MRVRHADELGLVVPREVDVAAVGDAGHDELGHAAKKLLEVERPDEALCRLEQQREPRPGPLGFGLRGRLALRGERVLRDVARDVDDELDAAVGRKDRRRAQREPAFPVAAAGPDVDDCGVLGAGQRLRGRQLLERDGVSRGVERLVQREALVRGESDELIGGGEANRACRGVVREQEPAVSARRRDPFLDRPQHGRELLAGLAQRVLGLRPLGDRREVVGDRPRQKQLPVAPLVRCVPVEHELPEQPAPAHQRDERKRPDALLADGPLDRRLEARCGHVLDEDRLRILHVGGHGECPSVAAR